MDKIKEAQMRWKKIYDYAEKRAKESDLKPKDIEEAIRAYRKVNVSQ